MKTFLEYARDYKAEYKKFQSSPERIKYRAELVKYNRDKGTYGNGDGKDASHKDGKIVGFEDQSKNRGRAEASRLKGSKRKVDELQMTSVQQISQTQKYWNDLRPVSQGSKKSVDDAKKKSLKNKFGISDIKLDRDGKIISYKTDRGRLVAGDECDCFGHELTEAEYQGRKVKLNEPTRAPSGDRKKFYVYVKNEKGNVIKLGFGDPNSEIKRDDPKRRAAFRARHSCDDDIGPKYKARYWSCYQWRAGAKVDN